MIIFTLVIAALGAGLSSAIEPDTKLPGDVKPVSYDLTLKIGTGNAEEYSGQVVIQVECKQETKRIVLHANDFALTVETDNVKLFHLENAQPAANPSKVSQVTHNKDGLLEIVAEENLVVNHKYLLEISFTGIIGPLGWIKHNKGFNEYLLAIDLKRTYARYVFPCFDDPDMKATFLVHVIRKIQANSFSNAQALAWEYSEENPGYVVEHYKETGPLSTYQLKIVVFRNPRYLQDHSQNKLPVHIYAQQRHSKARKKLHKLFNKVKSSLKKFNIEISQENNLYGTSHIFIPSKQDIRVETQGLLVKSENHLHYGDIFDTEANVYSMMESLVKHYLERPASSTTVLPSELWKSQWLFTCLARYISLVGKSESFYRAKILPQWFAAVSDSNSKSMNDITDDKGGLQQEDSAEKLNKGLMLLLMFENIVGKDHLLSSLKKFDAYKGFKNQNVFWQFLAEPYGRGKSLIGGHDTTTALPFIHSWTLQQGIPLVTVERTSETENTLVISQKRFMSKKEAETASQEHCWWIPLTYATADKPERFSTTAPMKWLGCDRENKPLQTTIDVDPKHWIVLNNQMKGMYRVNYDKRSWELISQALNSETDYSKIHVYNRAQLVYDALTLSFMKYVDFYTAFNLAFYLQYEEDPKDLLVFKAFFEAYDIFKKTLNSSVYMNHMLREYPKYILRNIYNKVFPTAEDLLKYIENDMEDNDYEIKIRIHRESCNSRVVECFDHADTIAPKIDHLLHQRKDSRNPLAKGLVCSVLCALTVTAKSVELSFLFLLLEDTYIADDQRSCILESLKCVRIRSSQEIILNWATTEITDENIEDKVHLIKTLQTGTDSVVTSAAFLYSNFVKINSTFSEWDEYIGTKLVYGFVKTMVCTLSPSQLTQMQASNIPRDEKIKKLIESDKELKNCPDHETDHQWVDENEKELKEAMRKIFAEYDIYYPKEADFTAPLLDL